MKIEINPQDTSRAEAFMLWMSSPMPMVTLTKTFDVTNLLKTSKKRGVKFNALLCWCIGKAASRIDEFYLLPEQNKLFRYDRIAVNVIVNNQMGGINSCDIPFVEDIKQFAKDYNYFTGKALDQCQSSFLVLTELDSIVNQYTDKFSNPMVMWGKYRKHWFKTTLPISFQFHHAQMDGGHAAKFLQLLQQEIKLL